MQFINSLFLMIIRQFGSFSDHKAQLYKQKISMAELKSDLKSSINPDPTQENYQKGVEGKWAWPIRIGSVASYVFTVAFGYLYGGSKNGQISNKYSLYTTPPGYFFAIWGFIYTSLFIVIIYNLVKNQWNRKAHLFFVLSNLTTTLWTIVFDIGTDAPVFIAGFILILTVPIILKTWQALGERPKSDFDKWTYITRNVFAFYLGWVIAAANLGLGIDMIYWWGASKQTQLAIFWVMAPLSAIGATALNYVQEGKQGLLSCFMLWVSVLWAFSGAAITSNGCLNGTISNC